MTHGELLAAIQLRAMNRTGASNSHWKGGLRPKNCQWCGALYRVYLCLAAKSKFCSRVCHCRANAHAKSARAKAGIKIDVRCSPRYGPRCRLYVASRCGHLTRKKSRKWCEHCRKVRFAHKSAHCVACGKRFEFKNKGRARDRKVCSPKCRNEAIAIAQVGAKSHLWKGGRRSENMRLRASREAKHWRKAVFVRDNFTCVACGQHGGKLCADHIKPWALHPELRYELSNGRTMCWPCHRKTPTFGHRTSGKL
jgi:hypothetical protein